MIKKAPLILAAVLFAAACATSGSTVDPTAIELMRSRANAIAGSESDYDALLAAVGDARFVLLGEATHGTHEFYRERSRITKRLIEEKGFDVVALEADWSDAASLDAYAAGRSDARSAIEALESFERFPRWMWRNRESAELVEWIRGRNEGRSPKIRIVGIDLYGASESLAVVSQFLQSYDAAAATEVGALYRCFGANAGNLERWGALAATRRLSCADETARALEIVSTVRKRVTDPAASDILFAAEQNARVVRNAEEYFRELPLREVSSWNLRDRHMLSTLEAVVRYRGPSSGVVIWAHNSHVGDARETSAARRDEWNVGQLLRERHRGQTFIVGFSTYEGTVIAASEWGSAPRLMSLNRAIRASWEELFHSASIGAGYVLTADEALRPLLSQSRLQRAVGVIYRPMTERHSHYLHARIAGQFDAVIHIDRTTALDKLD